MTTEDRLMLNRIMEYANEVMPDINPQEVRISEQIDKLRPILQTLAMEKGMDVQDIFVKYMDLATENAVEYEHKMNTDFEGTFQTGEIPK